MKNLNISNQMARAIKKESGTFNAVRRNILAAASDGIVQNNKITKFLRKSKKDDNIFKSLSLVTGYTYKLVKEDDESTISKHYTVTSLLNACEIALNVLEIDTATAIKDEFNKISAANVVKAINKAKADMDKASDKLKSLKALAAVASVQEIKEYYATEIVKAQTNLDNKTALYNLVK